MCEVLKTRNDLTSEQLPASEPVAACVGEVAGGALRAARYARSQAQAARPHRLDLPKKNAGWQKKVGRAQIKK
jgi:hypothetical protein